VASSRLITWLAQRFDLATEPDGHVVVLDQLD
jgi:hypothetical protein